ncbi:sigma-70 family RNA polymerase sigma factor [Vagococcus xieshaowenii]|uniref:sigma-70 family RNA polymerase sigma factor n=1 Tax=Vagococcus xieshaowenii TaxID=2562451 RepID=UPI00143270F6|nr:sigma-70 family RNA polymerase sigma factor [Vagococcus xieshaowenii]
MVEERQLIIDAKQGKVDAFEKLFIKYRPVVYKLYAEYYIQGFELEDWLQEGQIVCYNSLSSFDLSKGNSFGSFFKMNFKRHIISLIRHQNALKRTIDFNSVSLEATLAEQGDYCLMKDDSMIVNATDFVHVKDRLETFVIRLSKFEREVFKEYVEGSEAKDIATNLVCNVDRVNNALDRIKKKLKIQLI